MEPRTTKGRAFSYRGGVRITGTIVACDATVGSDLVFLSHASVLAARARRDLPSLGRGRRQLLTTELTLALLGPTGARLRPQALVAAFGRPFLLGNLRLELFASGFMPGAASLLCESNGRRMIYAGPIGAPGGHAPSSGAADAGAEVAVRAADALCLDATFGMESAQFPPRAAALASVGRAVRALLAAGSAPVLLVEPAEVGLAIATALSADRMVIRAHRELVQAALAYRDAGLPAPVLQRYADRVGPAEVLLWPAALPPPARRRGSRPYGLVVVSAEPDRRRTPAIAAGGDRTEPATSIVFPTGADFAGLLDYVAATGAREVALVNAPGEDLPCALRARGIDVYALGPPRQIELFAARGTSPPATAPATHLRFTRATSAS